MLEEHVALMTGCVFISCQHIQRFLVGLSRMKPLTLCNAHVVDATAAGRIELLQGPWVVSGYRAPPLCLSFSEHNFIWV